MSAPSMHPAGKGATVAGGDVVIRREGHAGRITLNRPKALNALTREMALEVEAALDRWAHDDAIALVVMDAAAGKAFCAGGDIQKLYAEGKAGNYDYGRRFWRDEYRLNRKIARFRKPFVALVDGMVMGGGVGLVVHGSHRIVTEHALVAMPECSIGLVPDVGVSRILATAPGRLGEYLGLTGFRMKAVDAVLAGFADETILARDLDALTGELCETGDAKAISGYRTALADGTLNECRPAIDRLFAGRTIADILAALGSDESAFAAASLGAIQMASPLSAAVFLDLLRTVRADPTIETALREEYRFTFRSQSEGEFLEGIRAAVIDKDRNPKWSPGWDEELPPERVAAMRRSLGRDELVFE